MADNVVAVTTKKTSILVIFLSVFLDLIGFGIVLPLLPIYAQDFGATGAWIGVIIASYSGMQFLLAPAWGRLSDRIGRRPVMLISNAGAAGSYALFAWGSTLGGVWGLWVLLISRVFAGVCGANLSVASAYIADITPPERRSARMGVIGMAFGLGFILGPALGSASATLLGLPGPGWVAAGLCAGNFGLGWFILGESRRGNSEGVSARPRLGQWLETFRQPRVGLLVGILFLAMFCFSSFESTFSLLAKYRLRHGQVDELKVGYLFTYCGFLSALVQGGLIGRLVKWFGEPNLIGAGLLLVAASLAILPYQTGYLGLMIALGLFALGAGITRPPIFGMLSNLCSADEQGAHLGVAQSAGSLARILGPVFATSFYTFRTPEKATVSALAMPYWSCGAVAFLGAGLVWYFFCRNRVNPGTRWGAGNATPRLKR